MFSKTLSIIGIGLVVLTLSAGIVCTLSIGNRVLHKIFMNKYRKHRKQYGKDQQTIKSFDKLNRNSLQDNVFDKSEYESHCNIFTKLLNETKNESLL